MLQVIFFPPAAKFDVINDIFLQKMMDDKIE
jgi:hypothetical protein